MKTRNVLIVDDDLPRQGVLDRLRSYVEVSEDSAYDAARPIFSDSERPDIGLWLLTDDDLLTDAGEFSGSFGENGILRTARSRLETVGFSKYSRGSKLVYYERSLHRRWAEWQFLREKVLFFCGLGLFCLCTVAVILIVGGYFGATQTSAIGLAGLAAAVLRHLVKSGV